MIELDFYRHRDNWHKLPVIRSIICWLGRHDYENFGNPDISATKEFLEVVLECFYCEHRKSFYFELAGRGEAPTDAEIEQIIRDNPADN